MKAIILCGGEGTHLRPLTCNLPKPALTVCGKPLIFYTTELLRRHGIKDITLALGYRGEVLEELFDPEETDEGISFVSEDSPLGTAGAVKKASGGDDVLVICGDVLCDFDLTKALLAFRESHSDAAVIVREDDEFSSRTAYSADENSVVTSVSFRPPKESCESYLSDTGVYILSGRTVSDIDDDVFCDITKDLFPKMLASGKKILAVRDNGYHRDIDDITQYLGCQRDVLDNRVSLLPDGHRTLGGITCSGRECYSGARITPPVYIGKNVTVEDGAVIDSYSVLCDNVTVCRGAKIHGSVLCEGVYVGERVTCNSAVICEGASLSDGSSVYENAVVGAGSTVGKNSVIESGVRIWAKKNISPAADVTFDIKYGTGSDISMSDEGICGDAGIIITPRTAALIGSALSGITDRVCIGHNHTPSGRAIALAVASGASSSGTDVYFAGECTVPQTDFVAVTGNIPYQCYIEGGALIKIRFYSAGGLPVPRRCERIIEDMVRHHDFPRASFSHFGNIFDVSGTCGLYITSAANRLSGVSGVSAEATSSDKNIVSVAQKVFSCLSGGERIVFNISSDGRRVSAYSEKSGYVFYDKLLLLACREEFRRGRNVALPYSAPVTADLLAEKYRAKTLRYSSCPTDNSDDEARKLATKFNAPLDAISLAVTVLSGLSERKQTLAEAVAELPDFSSASRFVPMKSVSAKLLRTVCAECVGNDEGVLVGRDGARVILHPIKSGRGAMLLVESFSTESASEICDFYERELKKRED